MFCKNCGSPCNDDAKFCKNCGTALQEAPQAAPAAAAPATVNLNSVTAAIKKYMTFILVGIAVLALILSIMNLFSTFDVAATVSAGDEKETESGPIKDMFEDETDGAFTMALIGNILFGISNLAIAAVGVLYFLQKNFNIDIYNKFVTKVIKDETPAFMIGVVGAGAALIQIIFYALCKYEYSFWGFEVAVTIAAHWTTWVALFLYAALAAADKFLLNKKN